MPAGGEGVESGVQRVTFRSVRMMSSGLFAIAELNTHSFQIAESAFTVMAMTSGAADRSNCRTRPVGVR